MHTHSARDVNSGARRLVGSVTPHELKKTATRDGIARLFQLRRRELHPRPFFA